MRLTMSSEQISDQWCFSMDNQIKSMNSLVFPLLLILLCLVDAVKSQETADSNPLSSDSALPQERSHEPIHGFYGNHVAFWNESANDFFDAEPILLAANAITRKEQQQLQQAVEQIEDINTPGRSGVTLAYWAYLQGNLEAFKFLLSRGASPDVAPTKELGIRPGLDAGRTVGIGLLAHAADHTLQRPGFFEAGFEYTKHPNQLNAEGGTLLHSWAPQRPSPQQLELLKKIIDAGVDLDAKCVDMTAFQMSAYTNPQAMIVLMDAGARVDSTLPDGSPLIGLLYQAAILRRKPDDYSEILKRLTPSILGNVFASFTQQQLNLTDEQQLAVQRLQNKMEVELKKILTEEQWKQLRPFP